MCTQSASGRFGQPCPLADPDPHLALPPAAVRELDRLAMEELAIPGPVLMENAARALVAVTLGMVRPGGRILFITGPGNNGGDGMAALRLLAPRGELLLVGDPARLRGDCLLQWRILAASGVPTTASGDPERARTLLAGSGPGDLVVDAIFGTGLDREVGSPYREVIEAINASPAPVLAADIPSGLCGKTGRIMGTAVEATATVTFGLPKTGLYRNQGPACCGSLHLGGIGIPTGWLERFLARQGGGD